MPQKNNQKWKFPIPEKTVRDVKALRKRVDTLEQELKKLNRLIGRLGVKYDQLRAEIIYLSKRIEFLEKWIEQ